MQMNKNESAAIVELASIQKELGLATVEVLRQNKEILKDIAELKRLIKEVRGNAR